MRRRRACQREALKRILRGSTEALVLAGLIAGCGDDGRHGLDGGGPGVVDGRPESVPDAPAGIEPGMRPVEPPALPPREDRCADDLDDDGDDEIDCADDDCAAESACVRAPALDRTIAPGFHDAVRFLYQGPHAVQKDAHPAVFDSMRVSVLRGRVLARDGASVNGVRVAVHGNDAYGYTETRDGGMLDLVVNGGGPLTVNYRAPGFSPVQRTIETGYRRYHRLPDVVLTPLDPAVTEIVPGAAEPQVARGSVQEDEDGARQATLVFPAGMQATAVLPDGTEMTLDSMSVRATEYTMGERGPEAMPGTLPATSGYTYAVELSVDEADAMGASSVVFDRPVGFYLENFLDFPVGTSVPLGWYDRAKAAWISADSGVVLAIIDAQDGLAAIDLDGDGMAEDDVELAAAGISMEERAELAALYAPGQTLWHASITHFTPWDCNWPFGPPDDAIYPDDDFLRDPDHERPCTRGGSIIQCERQSLGQLVDVPGAGVSLAYHGHRKRGWHAEHSIDVQLTSADLPASIESVLLEVEIAGQHHEQRFAAEPDMVTSFAWDGRDAYGRRLQGLQRARVRVGYAYGGVYGNTNRFGNPGAGGITGVLSRMEVVLWRETMVPVGIWDVQPQGLGGFGLASHHAYDPEGQTLFLGNGTQRSARSVAPVLSELHDFGLRPIHHAVHAMHAAADGSVYAASLNSPIWRIAPDGAVSLVGGGGGPRDIAVAPDGTVYVAEGVANRVTAIAPDGTHKVVAGSGTDAFLDDDGAVIPATQVALNHPWGLALAPDGGLYIADRDAGVVRHVDPTGMLGNLPVRMQAWDVELGPDGSLYAAYAFARTVSRVHPDGRVEIVLDSSAGIQSQSLAVRPDGTLLVADQITGRVVAIHADGARTIVAGGGQRPIAHGEIATDVAIPTLHRIDVDAEGALLLSDGRRVYRVAPAVPGVATEDIVVPSHDGSELHVFDPTGRHRETRDALTGVVLLSFAYDDHGRVIAMLDRDGLPTHIERDAHGLARAVVGPYGQRTALHYDEHDQLARVVDPLQREVSFGYDEAGRLTSMRDARDGLHRYEYDEAGRLLRDIGPTGYTQTLAPAEVPEGSPATSSVRVTTSRNRATGYEVQTLGPHDTQRVMHLASGLTGTVRKRAGRTEVTSPDGTAAEFSLASDARWHSQAPWAREARVRTPQGRTFAATSERAVSFEDPAHPHHITAFEQRYTIGARTGVMRYDAAARTVTGQRPSGRQRTVTLDERGRVVRSEQPGLAPVVYEYDQDGRVAGITRGTGADARVTRFHHDAHGNLVRRVDPLQRTHHYERDVIGRALALIGPDGARIELGYDAHDNLTRVAPPGRPAHELRYNGADQAERYIPPAIAGVDAEVGFRYDADLAPEAADGPGEQRITFHHDQAGRIESIALARGDYVYEYDPATGHLVRLTSPDAVGLHYGRDGPLLRETRWTIPGAADAVVGLDYDDAFRLGALTIQDAAPIEHGYDADDYLTQAGPLAIVRDVQTGLPDLTRAGAIETDLDVSQFAEPERFSATFAGEAIYRAVYQRDALGRITHIDEIVAGQSRAVAYGYDDADRLAYVEEQGQPARELLYDPNGNLVESREAGIPVLTATHDAQDRLVTHGRFALTHTDSGHLASKTDTLTGESTAYRYDEFGNLLGVGLADGRSIQYLIDGADRRVAKLVDGELQWLLVYVGGLPVARLHPDGAVESIYGYGALAHVPDVIIKAGRTYRIIHDHLGSPRLVVDVETGEIAQRLDYDVHGRVLVDTSPDFQPFGFVGGLHDVDTGLVRFGARDYDPELGRWTAKDPSGFAGGDTNLYAYAYGDPVNFIDPDGELAFLVPLAILALKGAIVGAATDAGIELASQLIDNGGNIDCLDWGDIGASGLSGGISGGLTGPLGKALTGVKGLGRAARAGKTPRQASAVQRENALKRAQGLDGKERCSYCGTELDRRPGMPNSAEIDHRQAYSRGGETVDSNLAATCRSCNRSKGAKELGTEWIPPNER